MPKVELKRIIPAASFIAVAVFTSVFASACAANTDEPVDDSATAGSESTREPIVGGTQASGYPESALISLLSNGQVFAACSGAVIAPQVVLTAGHCVVGANGWTVRAPFAGNQNIGASGAQVYDYTSTAETVDAKHHDVALIYLSKPIALAAYPSIATTKLADGAKVINVGRINNGVMSSTSLFQSPPIAVSDATKYGFPFDYVAEERIESGDSGGPDFLAGTHTIVAVNSGGGGGTEVLARVDLLSTWISQQIAAHGGPGGGTGSGGSTGSGGGAGSGGSTGSSCSHATCSTGVKLVASCDPCVKTICAADAYCCNTKWDGICVQEVASLCGKTCN